MTYYPHWEDFIASIQFEKMYTPPARILFAGGDANFNEFVVQYVEHILHIVALIKDTNS